MILEQKGTRMAEDDEDWNGLEMTILKSLANFFKIHERWRSSFNNEFMSSRFVLQIVDEGEAWITYHAIEIRANNLIVLV